MSTYIGANLSLALFLGLRKINAISRTSDYLNYGRRDSHFVVFFILLSNYVFVFFSFFYLCLWFAYLSLWFARIASYWKCNKMHINLVAWEFFIKISNIYRQHAIFTVLWGWIGARRIQKPLDLPAYNICTSRLLPIFWFVPAENRRVIKVYAHYPWVRKKTERGIFSHRITEELTWCSFAIWFLQ